MGLGIAAVMGAVAFCQGAQGSATVCAVSCTYMRLCNLAAAVVATFLAAPAWPVGWSLRLAGLSCGAWYEGARSLSLCDLSRPVCSEALMVGCCLCAMTASCSAFGGEALDA